MIGINGAQSGLDVARMMLAGAHAVEIASAAMLRGFQTLSDAVAELETYLGRKEISARDLIGRAADARKIIRVAAAAAGQVEGLRSETMNTALRTQPEMLRSRRSMMPSFRFFAAALAAALMLTSVPADAQQAWPAREVKFVVPFASGTTSDILARAVAQHVAGVIGKPVIVDNQGGAGGNVGAACGGAGAARRTHDPVRDHGAGGHQQAHVQEPDLRSAAAISSRSC